MQPQETPYRQSLDLDAQCVGLGKGASLMSHHLLSSILFEPGTESTPPDPTEKLLAYFEGGKAEQDVALDNKKFARLKNIQRLFPVPREMACLTDASEFHGHVLTPRARQRMLQSPAAMRVYRVAVQRFFDHFHVPSQLWNPAQSSAVIREIARTQDSKVVFEVCIMFFRVMASTFMLSRSQFDQIAAAFNRKTFRGMCANHSDKMCGLNAALSWTDFLQTLRVLNDRYAAMEDPTPEVKEVEVVEPDYPVSDAEDAVFGEEAFSGSESDSEDSSDSSDSDSEEFEPEIVESDQDTLVTEALPPPPETEVEVLPPPPAVEVMPPPHATVIEAIIVPAATIAVVEVAVVDVVAERSLEAPAANLVVEEIAVPLEPEEVELVEVEGTPDILAVEPEEDLLVMPRAMSNATVPRTEDPSHGGFQIVPMTPAGVAFAHGL